MSFKNYLVQSDLYAYEPELTNYFRTVGGTAETNYTKQIDEAARLVADDLAGKGYNLRLLRPDLTLRTAGTSATATANAETSSEDILNRWRWVWNITSISGTTNTLTLKGTNDEETYTTVLSTTVTATGEASAMIGQPYKYYRLTVGINTGWLDCSSYMTEMIYDKLVGFKTLALIFGNAKKEKEDRYDLKTQEYKENYKDKLENTQFGYDEDDSGDVSEDEIKKTHEVRITAG